MTSLALCLTESFAPSSRKRGREMEKI
jgi:hypothetical protein